MKKKSFEGLAPFSPAVRVIVKTERAMEVLWGICTCCLISSKLAKTVILRPRLHKLAFSKVVHSEKTLLLGGCSQWSNSWGHREDWESCGCPMRGLLQAFFTELTIFKYANLHIFDLNITVLANFEPLGKLIKTPHGISTTFSVFYMTSTIGSMRTSPQKKCFFRVDYLEKCQFAQFWSQNHYFG